MNTVSDEVADVLTQYGWSPDRKVDVSDVLAFCKTYRYKVFDLYLEIITNTRGLLIEREKQPGQRGFERVWFDPLCGFSEESLTYARFKLWANCLPVAELDQILFLFLTPKGDYWVDSFKGLHFAGKSFDEAMQFVLFKK